MLIKVMTLSFFCQHGYQVYWYFTIPCLILLPFVQLPSVNGVTEVYWTAKLNSNDILLHVQDNKN